MPYLNGNPACECCAWCCKVCDATGCIRLVCCHWFIPSSASPWAGNSSSESLKSVEDAGEPWIVGNCPITVSIDGPSTACGRLPGLLRALPLRRCFTSSAMDSRMSETSRSIDSRRLFCSARLTRFLARSSWRFLESCVVLKGRRRAWRLAAPLPLTRSPAPLPPPERPGSSSMLCQIALSRMPSIWRRQSRQADKRDLLELIRPYEFASLRFRSTLVQGTR